MSMRKVIEGATKPKRAAPKAKATFQQDGQIREIVQCLSARMRDPTQTVVFKSLIVLHTVMRSGQLDAVFSYLSNSSTSLSLSSPEGANVAAYGQYLGCRIKSYGNLKRDVVRDKSDRRATNRLKTLTVEQGLLRETREIQRMIAALVEAKFYNEDVNDDVSMTALRLLVKDLLVLFTAVNEGVINVLEHYFEMSHVDATLALKIYKTFCRDTEKVVAYLGTAKRLYNVLNIPIPNLRHAPLSLAKSLEEYLNDPNFEQNREEYKENKRIADGGRPRSTPPKSNAPAKAAETTTSSASSPSAAPSQSAPSSSTAPKSFTDFFESIEQQQTSMFGGSPQPAQPGAFPGAAPFGTFMGAQPTGMPFGGGGQPGLMPQMTGNPFLQPQMTGFPGGGGMGGMGMQPQMTGFGGLQPQMTGMPNPFRQSTMMTGGGGMPNPFAMQQPQPNGMGMGPFGAGPGPRAMQPQMTGAPGGPFGQGPSQGGPFRQTSPFAPQQQPQQQQQHLSPQATGNPFGAPQRAMSMSQPTGGNPFGARPQSMMPQATGMMSSPPPASPAAASPSPFASSAPQRAETMPAPAPLTQQKTGMRNPFAPAPGTAIPQSDPQPAAPAAPSMNELATSSFGARLAQQQTGMANGSSAHQPQWATFGQSGGNQQQQGQQQGQGQQGHSAQQQQQEQPKKLDAFSAFVAQQREKEAAAANGGPAPLISQKTGGLFASVATDLARGDGQPSASSAPTSPFATTGSAFPSAASRSFSPSATTATSSVSGPFSSLSISTSGVSSPGTSQNSAPYLTSQSTGFANSNVKPFQPTSSFGSKLATEFGGGSSPLASQPTGAFGASPGGANGTASAASPLQPQGTGFNQFGTGGTKLPPLNAPLSSGLTVQQTGSAGLATGSLI
ncbi:hypothetical protein JCM8202v2_003639 [Rhodotorula sphaerocarpa]